MTKRHHVEVQHLHGKFFCGGHHGDLHEVAQALMNDGYPADMAIEVIDAPTGAIILHPHEPLSALRALRHPMSEVFGKR